VYSLTRLSLTDPSIADIVEADDEEILIIGQVPGKTTLFIWDEYGKRTISIHVALEDLEYVQNRIEELFSKVGIHEIGLKPNQREGRIVLTGNLPKEKELDFNKITDPFGASILKLVNIYESEDIIQIDMQVTELSETLSKTLGIAWGSDNTNGNLAFTYEENPPGDVTGSFINGDLKNLFNIGEFTRTTSLIATVNALVSEGKGRILSKPRLTVKSGAEGSFNVGGEIPVRTSSETASGTVDTVEYKSYGITLSVSPQIVQNNKINLNVSVTISDIDPGAPSEVSDVAFITRTAQTVLLVEDKQPIVIAGLIRHLESENSSKVPYLSAVPVLGALFRSKSIPSNTDSEVVIAMTPTIMSDYKNSRGSKKNLESPNMETKTNFSALKAAPYYSGVNKEMTTYIQMLQQKISQSIAYPKEAEQYGWEGTVKVGLHILNDGTLAFAMVKETSGYKLFDESALMTAKNIAPYSQFPIDSDLQELNITIPIVYSIQKKY
jgi:pilus assembly protein CpaC